MAGLSGKYTRVAPLVFVSAMFTIGFIGSHFALKREDHARKPVTVLPQDTQIKLNQSKRKGLLNQVCPEILRTKTEEEKLAGLRKTFSHILVDETHKVMYCWIPKTGCKQWKFLMVNLNSKKRMSSPNVGIHAEALLNRYKIYSLNKYNAEEITLRLQTYYKFMFVRHPLSRVLSAFRHKFYKTKEYTIYASRILKYNKKIKTDISRMTVQMMDKYNFTFTDFLRYIFESKDLELRYDRHWDTYDRLCSPCLINYNYIGKQETFFEDATYLLRTVFNTNNTKLTNPNWTGSGDSLTRKYFAAVPGSLKKTVVQEYLEDARMFDYDMHGY